MMHERGVSSQQAVTGRLWPPLGQRSPLREHLCAEWVWSFAHIAQVACFCLQTVWWCVRGALQQMFERKMAVEEPVKAKINVQVRIKISNA